MVPFSLFTIIATIIFGVAQAIPTISVTGSKFFTSDGKQFYIKGTFEPIVTSKHS